MRKKIYVCRETIFQLKETGDPKLCPIVVETDISTIRCSELSITGPSKLITDITSDPTVFIQTDSAIIANGHVIE